MTAQWISLAEADRPDCGGKARGLARLIAAGLPVPDGGVIVGAASSRSLDALDAWLVRLGPGPFAVRSSATVEDGEQDSYAGQFESVLGLADTAAVGEAIDRCLASRTSERVGAYQHERGEAAAEMAVVVQRMVDARCAGVLFTCDPLTGARDRWTIEAVAGLGEALVAGHARPDRHQLDPVQPRSSCISQLAGDEAVLRDGELEQLVAGALAARERLGGELDMEWAIDRSGQLLWLQARPITRVGALALDELDTPMHGPTFGFTRYNIGEILPGAVTPMTASTSVELVDRGMRRFYARLGVIEPDVRCLVMASGHAFVHMYGPYRFAAMLAGADKPGADRALGGRVFDELDGIPPHGRARRLLTALRLFPILWRSEREVERAERALAAVLAASQTGLVDELDALMRIGVEVSTAHLSASTWSGMLATVLEQMLTGGGPLEDEQRRLFSELLAGIGAVESADIGIELAALIETARTEGAGETLARLDEPETLAWLRSDASGAVGRAFTALLDRHGHRCFREFELRERSWADDPGPLLAAVRAGLAAPPRARRAPVSIDELKLPAKAERGIRWIVPRAHAGIRLRERSKSLFVRAARELGRRIDALARELVERGQLAEVDLVYFLTYDELLELARGQWPGPDSPSTRARRRRRVHARQSTLRFAMVSRDKPEPLPPAAPRGDATRMRGCAVSPGVVEGRARVARTIDEARSMVAGEILIVPFTDVGWTPFFGLAAGLATEVGGTLSHGAVIARELGLPAIVDLQGATESFRTGQRVRLDADRGELVALD